MDKYTRLAKESLENYILNQKVIDAPEDIPEEMEKPAAVFVSLKEDGTLRGCIGSLAPTTPSAAEEIIRYAIYAGTQDPRFMPVRKDELNKLIYSVDVLGDPEPVTDKSQLDPQVYGVIVSAGQKRGVLLPALDGVDTMERQLEIALSKGGISPAEPFSVERFKVVRHK